MQLKKCYQILLPQIQYIYISYQVSSYLFKNKNPLYESCPIWGGGQVSGKRLVRYTK
jgi:hypothetical protein